MGSSSYFSEYFYGNCLDLPLYYSFFNKLQEIEDCDFCILFGFNPRLELPLLNVRLRKAIKHKNAFVLVFGYFTNLTFKFYNISNKIDDFLRFIEGKLIVCRKKVKMKKPLFLQGDSLLYRADNNNFLAFKNFFQFILNKLKNLFKIDFSINNVTMTSGFINCSEVGFYNKTLFDKSSEIFSKFNSYCFYLLNISDTRFLYLISKYRKYFFLIYQGHTGSEISSISNVILPGSNFTEQKVTYFNLERRAQSSSFIKLPPILSRSDWSIIVAFSFFIGKPLKYTKIKELTSRILMLTPIVKNIKNKSQLNNYLTFNKKINICFYQFFNFPIISFFFNHYNTNNITNSSQTLSFISRKFVKNQNYYSIEI